MDPARTFVGTSGWSYAGWKGPFYPPGTSAAGMLQAYAAAGLNAVEAHNTYRRRPPATMLEKWCASVPETFRFAPKVHAAISHQRDLDGLEERVAAFFDALAPLGERRGPVLFSLPHKFIDLERLDRLLAALPASAGAAFELDRAWHEPGVLQRLDRHGAAVVFVDKDDGVPPDRVPETGSLAYVRLRRTAYDERALDEWAHRLRAIADAGRDAYAFVRHDDDGDAPRWARALRDRL